MTTLNLENETDLQSLIDNQVKESLYLDYKQAAALENTDGKKNEISRDISSFANSDGGQIIYGIKERKHLPIEIDGLEIEKRQWLNQVVNSRIYPRISELRIQEIPLKSGKYAFIVSIPQSYTAHQAHDRRYWKRTELNKEQMYDYEIKQTINRGREPRLKMIIPEDDSKFNSKVSQLSLKLIIKNEGSISAKSPEIYVHIPTELSPVSQGDWLKLSNLSRKSSKMISGCKQYWLEWEHEYVSPIHPGQRVSISSGRNDTLAIHPEPLWGKEVSFSGYYEIYAENMTPKYGEIIFNFIERRLKISINEIESIPL